ncbi:OsmC family protein [Actinoplanes sp. NPDC020271]|uniref:OsmC family protein n=1 Tax=Actinoplanes sp. NPDC020271 TaxID=3363896 RepID=UPI003788F731
MPSNISVSVRQLDGTALAGTARAHEVAIDRPVAKGGTDSGPMGGELLLLALGGCFMSTLVATAAVDGYPLVPGAVRCEVTGTLIDAPTRFSEIVVSVAAPAGSREVLSKSLAKAERGCIVHNTLRHVLPVRFEYQWHTSVPV